MEITLAFLIGYFAGAKAGGRGLDDVISAAKAVRESEEFSALLDALRAHAASALYELARALGAPPDSSPTDSAEPAESVVDRVRKLMSLRAEGPTTNAS
jgi:hypothetical protein